MKFKSILATAAMGLLLASCQGGASSDTSSLGELKNASAADSLIYYFGQMRGAEFHRQAERDTTLDNAQAKKAYIQGVQAGINAAKANNEAYNQGLFLGMQMAMNLQQFKDDYGVELNKRIFMSSISEAVNADSLADTQEMQREFYKIIGKFNEEKEAREKAAAAESLTKEAQNLKLPKISDDVYGEVTVKTDSAQIKTGDNVDFDAKVTKINGQDLNAPLPKKGKVGARNLAAPLNDMLASLKGGETGRFITSARALFGPRVTQMGLEPADVVIVTLKASLLPADKADGKADKPKVDISGIDRPVVDMPKIRRQR